jgi:hypothetical protein
MARASLCPYGALRNWGGNATAIAGGVTAAAAVLREPVRNQMSYEQRLAMMANTAFSDRDTSGRRAGMQSMDQLVRRSVAVGGGSKESAAETLDTLLASGAVDYDSAEKLLPTLQNIHLHQELMLKTLHRLPFVLSSPLVLLTNSSPRH